VITDLQRPEISTLANRDVFSSPRMKRSYRKPRNRHPDDVAASAQRARLRRHMQGSDRAMTAPFGGFEYSLSDVRPVRPLKSAKPLLRPPVRKTVSGRTRIWKGDFERVHRQSPPESNWHTLPSDPSSPPQNKKKTVFLARSSLCKKKENLPLLLHAYPLTEYPASPSLFLFFTYFCPATANLVLVVWNFFWLCFSFLFFQNLSYNERRSRSYDDESMGIRR
jgi:hypothetical protein